MLEWEPPPIPAQVYEDDTHVHLVMEACHGGELHHAIGDRHYSERTVSLFQGGLLGFVAREGWENGRWWLCLEVGRLLQFGG